MEGNPVNFVDPTGHYRGQAAANYAKRWATTINSQYGEFGGSDCTNFVSQALKVGGLPEDNEWFFDRTFIANPNRCTGYQYPTPPLKCEWYCTEDDVLLHIAQTINDRFVLVQREMEK